MDTALRMLTELSRGFSVTLSIFFITILLSMPLGFLVALARLSKLALVRMLAAGYVWLLRGTPLLLQIYFVYYGLPNIRTVGGQPLLALDAMPAVCVAFVLNYAAYFGEIFRSGILSVDYGQWEAGKSLGMTGRQTMINIIAPQMFKTALPPIANEAITLVKDTALATAIAMNDLLRIARNIANREFDIVPYALVAVIYLAMTFVLTQFFSFLERKMSQGSVGM